MVASTSLQGKQPPSSLQISKYFLKRHVEEIKQEHQAVLKLGEASADEWVKGLDSRGKTKRFDVARWERWEASSGVQRMKDGGVTNAPELFRPTPIRPQTQLPASLPPRPATYHGYSGFPAPPLPPPGTLPALHGPVASQYGLPNSSYRE